MNTEKKIGYILYDKVEGFYLSIRGAKVNWAFRKDNAAVLTQPQAYEWQRLLELAKNRGGFSVIMVAL